MCVDMSLGRVQRSRRKPNRMPKRNPIVAGLRVAMLTIGRCRTECCANVAVEIGGYYLLLIINSPRHVQK